MIYLYRLIDKNLVNREEGKKRNRKWFSVNPIIKKLRDKHPIIKESFLKIMQNEGFREAFFELIGGDDLIEYIPEAEKIFKEHIALYNDKKESYVI